MLITGESIPPTGQGVGSGVGEFTMRVEQVFPPLCTGEARVIQVCTAMRVTAQLHCLRYMCGMYTFNLTYQFQSYAIIILF